jgi:hypothetical protein
MVIIVSMVSYPGMKIVGVMVANKEVIHQICIQRSSLARSKGNPLCVDLRIKSARTKTCSRHCIVMTGEAMMSLALNNSNSILE